MKTFIAITLVALGGLFANSIYSKKFTTLGGTEVAMNLYQGKKILLVNIATGSNYAATQLPQLQQLYQLYKDSLVIVAFPSNDFGNEPRNNEDIKALLKYTYRVTFPVSVLSGVKSNTATTHPVYKWLQNQGENGATGSKVKKDFQKYLIDKTGEIMGIFSADITPMDNIIRDAINQ